MMIQFLALFTTQILSSGASSVCPSYAYTETKNLSLSLGDVIGTWSNISKVRCASKCSKEDTCNGFNWNASDGLCTIGEIYLITDGTQRDNGSTTMYVNQIKAYICDGSYELRSNGDITRCVFISSQGLNYAKSSERCISDGGRLFKANSQELIDLVVEMGFEKGIGNERVYVGLDDISSEDTFVWSDGQQMTSEERSQLFPNDQPDNKGNEDCCKVRMFDSKLNDECCQGTANYICEIPAQPLL